MLQIKKSASILILFCLVFQLFFAVVDPAYAEESATPTPEPPAVDSSTSQTQTPAPAADPSAPNPFFEPIGTGAGITTNPSNLPADTENGTANADTTNQNTPAEQKSDNQISADAQSEPQVNEPQTLTEEETPLDPLSQSRKEGFACKNCELRQSNGSLVYSYNLDVPPGRNGLTPKISLDYSQLNKNLNSIAGWGWELDSGGSIERSLRKGVNEIYNLNEFKINLGGTLQTLLPITLSSGSYGTYGAKTDETFYQYEYLSDESWLVKDTKGNKYYFGETSGARQDYATTTTLVFKWMLDKVEDQNGNTITYTYTKDSGQIYPYKINYTNNGAENGLFEIEFFKEAEEYVSPQYTTGFSVDTNYRISEIQAKVNGSWVKKYALSYDYGDNGHRSMLASITEIGRDENLAETSLPTTTFKYNKGLKNWTLDANWKLPNDVCLKSESAGDCNPVFTDLNGDGLTDIISPIGGVFLNTGSGWSYPGWVIPESIFKALPNNNGYVVDNSIRVVDINGDGRADIIKDYVVAYTPPDDDIHKIYINNGNGWTLDSNWNLPVCLDVSNTGACATELMDINGDGLIDILSGQEGRVLLNNGSGWVYSDVQLPVEYYFFLSGLMPIGYVRKPEVAIVDVNGDGLPDVIHEVSSYPGWSSNVNDVYINNGKGWILDTNWKSVCTLYSEVMPGRGYCVFYDLNGDGLNDSLTQLNVGPYWLGGFDWNYPVEISYRSYSLSDPGFYKEPSVDVVDVNGDGLPDVLKNLVTNPPGAPNAKNDIYLNNARYLDLLSEIDLSQGGKEIITYKSSPQFRDSADNLLNPNLPSVMPVVAEIGYYDGLGKAATTTYEYSGGANYYDANDLFKREFAGFNKVKTTDAEGNYTLSYFHQGVGTATSTGEYDDHVSKIGKMYRQETYDKNGNLYALQINKYEKDDLGNGRFFPKLVRTLNVDYDGDADYKAKAGAFSYDNYGNLSEKVDYGEVDSISDDGSFTDTGTDLASTTISYAASSANYLVSLPTRQTLADQSGNKVKETKYYYDNQSFGNANIGNLTKEESWKTGSSYIDTEKTYNSYGLITQEKDPRDKATNFTYDPYNLYVATSTNPLSQIISFTYDYSTGKVKRTTDPNGNAFETVYDGLGRPLLEKQPDADNPGTLITKTGYSYDDNAFPQMARRIDYLNASSSTENYVYFDGLGRKIQERKQTENLDVYSVKDYSYDSRGLLSLETLPYFNIGTSSIAMTAASALFTRYSYDPLQRIKTVVNILATTTTDYDDWEVTITDGEGKEKDLYKDAFGNLIRVDEHKATSTYSTYYQYNLQNNLIKITDALNNVRNFIYDGLGRRLTAEDLHAPGDATYGTWTYIFDDSGNLASRVDPKSQTVNYTYDDLNRPLTEDYTGGAGTEVSYGYDTCSNGKGKLCSATTTASILNLAYNPLGLTSSERKTIGTTTYATLYGYDRQGNPVLITLPDNTQIKYEYNDAGLTEKVLKKSAGDPDFANLVLDFDYSPLGQITREEDASGLSTYYTYDPEQLYRLKNKKTIHYSSDSEELASDDSPRPIDNPIPEEKSITIYSGVGDGSVGLWGSPWSNIHDAADGDERIDTDPYAFVGTWFDLGTNFRIIRRGFFPFDTSVLGPTASINSASFNVFINQKHVWGDNIYNWLNVVQATPASSTALSLADYDQCGPTHNATEGSDRKMMYPINTPFYTDFDLNQAALGWINNTGWTNLGIRQGEDVLDIQPGYNNYNSVDIKTSESGTSTAPYLVVTYTHGGSAPAAPTSLKSNGLTNPTLSDPAPGLTALYNDADPNDLAKDFRIQVSDTQGSFANPIWDSGRLKLASTTPAGQRSEELIYRGLPLLTNNATYYWRIKFWDDEDNEGDWSTEAAQFTTSYASYVQNLNYTYDKVGNITQIIDSSNTNTAKTSNFAYDDLYRLTSAQSTNAVYGGNFNETYSYNAIGNITNKSNIGNYLYQNTNYASPHAVTSINGIAYAYDNNGNLTNDGTWIHTWDYDNRLTQSQQGTSTPVTYTYDQDGNRVKKTESGHINYYINKFYEIDDGLKKRHIFAGDTSLATIEDEINTVGCMPPTSGDWTISSSCTLRTSAKAPASVIINSGATLTIATSSILEIDLKHFKLLVKKGGGVKIKKGSRLRQTTAQTLPPTINSYTYFHYTDHLGGSSLDTDQNGNVVQLLDYYPFGGIRLNERSGNIDNKRKAFGHEYDDGTDLYYMRARYQNPSVGRFISIDPVFNDIGINRDQFNAKYGQELEQLLSDPQMFNSYAYARNNPIIYIDPNGNLSWKEVKIYGSIALSLAKDYAKYKANQEWQEYQEWSQRNAEWIEAHPKEFDAMLMLLSKSPVSSKSISKGPSINIGNLRTSLKNINVESFEKTLFKGNIDLKPTLEKIIGGELKARDIFRNDKGLLPPQETGYYKEYVHPTPGAKDAGPQRIIQGKGGEYYYSPDHYKTFTPLN